MKFCWSETFVSLIAAARASVQSPRGGHWRAELPGRAAQPSCTASRVRHGYAARIACWSLAEQSLSSAVKVLEARGDAKNMVTVSEALSPMDFLFVATSSATSSLTPPHLLPFSTAKKDCFS